MMNNSRILCVWFFFFACILSTSTSRDILALSQSIRDGETLISAGGTFEMGFFSPGTSTNRYLGVWYKNLSPLTVVWVANRETPLQNNSGVLKVNEKGVIVLMNGTNNSVWSSNRSSKVVSNPIARLLDTGNLVVKNGQDSKEDQFLWQSFDYPCDIFMPGMRLGRNLVTGQDSVLSSWKSADDPAKGEYSFKIDIRGYPQMVFMKGSIVKFRVGSWNGLAFTGYPTQQFQGRQRFKFVMNAKEVYHLYENLYSLNIIYKVKHSGIMQCLAWTSHTSDLKVITPGAADSCDSYAFCGANSMCTTNSNVPRCECLKGCVPKFPEQWNISYWSGGCVPMNKDICKIYTDRFMRYTNMKLPETSLSWYSKTMKLEECQKMCLKNCSCSAYANLDIRDGGSGCLLWFDDLVDMRRFSQWGQDLYIRVPASELDNGLGSKKKSIIGITVGVIIFGLLVMFVSRMILRKQVAARVHGHLPPFQWRQEYFRLRNKDMDLPTFDFSTIAKATEMIFLVEINSEKVDLG